MAEQSSSEILVKNKEQADRRVEESMVASVLRPHAMLVTLFDSSGNWSVTPVIRDSQYLAEPIAGL